MKLVLMAGLLMLTGFSEAMLVAGDSAPGFHIALPAENHTEEQWQAMRDDASLRTVQMIGTQVGYAAGDHGVVRKTQDGGQTWDDVSTPVDCRWNTLCFLTDRIGWLAGGQLSVSGQASRGCLLHTRDGGASWKMLHPPECGMIHHVQFFDLQQGVVCGESTLSGTAGIWRTTDGGTTWQALRSSDMESWRCAAFIDVESGVVAGLQGKVALATGSKLLKDRTLNLGMKGVQEIQLNAAAQGWLVGEGGLVRCSQGGAIWRDPPGLLPEELKTLFDFRTVAQVEQSVWIAGHPGSAIWYSNDAGQNWQMAVTPVTAPLNSISFGSLQNGCAVGELGTILYTTDGGKTWKSSSGQSRRLALLQYAPRSSDSSLTLMARYSGHHGYRSGVIVLCTQETGSRPAGLVAEDLRLQQAVNGTSGNVARVSWTLPLDAPELEQNQQFLISRWNQATDGQLADLVLSHLVRDLRTYRPTVVVLDLPAETDKAGTLLRSAMLNAIRSAADPTWLVDQQVFAGLKPWKVQRVFERNRGSREAAGANIILDNGEYLAGLHQSVRMAVGPASQLLQTEFSQIPLSESFHLAKIDESAEKINLLDLFTGIILGPGSDARRPLLPADSPEQKAGESLARHQRNFSAYARTHLAEERHGAQIIAKLNEVVRGAPSRQAVQQLLELAEKYRQNGQWDYYEAVLMQAIENYPTEPLTGIAAAQLIPFWVSAEMTQLRLSNRNTSVMTRQLDTLQMQSDFQNVLQTAVEEPELLTGSVQPAVQLSQRHETLTPGSRKDRANWETTWQQRALSVYQFLQKTSPELAQSADVQLAIASLYRRQGSQRGMQTIYQQYLNPEVGSESASHLMQQIAETEFWLLTRSGLSPKRYLSCYGALKAPYLDGLLSDECWQQAEELRLKFPANSPAASSAAFLEAPILMIAHDNEYFYLAGSFPRHPDLPATLPVKGTRHYDTDLTGYDRLQIAFDLDRDFQSSYVLEVDQRGLTRETCWQEQRWNPQWFVACQGESSHWRVELAIPLKELTGDRPLKNGDIWGLSLSRILPGLGVQSLGEQTGATPERSSYHFLHFR